MFSNPLHPSLLVSALGGVLIMSVLPARACGPDFPNAYLASSVEDLASLPTLSFAAELERLQPTGTIKPKFLPADNSTAMIEVREALAAAGLSHREIESALAGYRRESPPRALPREFHLYALGAQAWRSDRIGEALHAWRELLALPPEARRYRTTWAAYMIGRALWDSDGDLARASFQEVRRAAQAKFADSEGLAVSSLGWEARVHLRKGDYAEALRLYFQQFSAGDPGALASLQLSLQKLFQHADDQEAGISSPGAATWEGSLQKIAGDRLLRGIVTAWFASKGGPHAPWSLRATRHFRLWLGALPKSGSLDAVEADRWAWTAYQNGLWSDAEAFAKLAPADAPASEWVRAMLLLRSGDIAAATDHLASATRGFPEDKALGSELFLSDDTRFAATHEDLPFPTLAGVRGVLALQREQYLEALRLFLQAGHWADAAYVAERVLTVDELASFVQDETSAQTKADADNLRKTGAPVISASCDLRHLLARRLVRAGQFDRARAFYPAELGATFDLYVSSIRTGYREDLPARPRAEALWRAAQIAQERGMELQGTELAPDYAITKGNFEWPDTGEIRGTDGNNQTRASWHARNWPPGFAGLITATPDEFARTGRQPPPTKRFHYRHRAAQLAWLASTLLPDNDDLTATILNTAGQWIAARYPEEAELFYKTLTFRCPHTALGKAAAARHWLVPASAAAAGSG